MDEYNEKEHVKRLLWILEQKYPCAHCPGGLHHTDKSYAMLAYFHVSQARCKICLDFVNTEPENDRECPCLILGKEEAIRRTWLSLEKGGYLV